MVSDATILAFDTSAAHCAAAVLVNGSIAAVTYVPMAKGQAENLMDIIDQTLAQAGLGLAELDAIAVGTGPGNFTGIRISVSAARGLGLALGCPVIGVTSFDAIWFDAASPIAAIVPAPRDQIYYATSDQGSQSAILTTMDSVPSKNLPMHSCPAGDELVRRIAQVGARRYGTDHGKPTPFYIKPADAAPSRDLPPRRLP